MHHRAVLDGGSAPHPDPATISAKDRAGPHGGLGSDGHRSDDDGIGVNEGVGSDVGD